jgi:Tol biopolymer transport system component
MTVDPRFERQLPDILDSLYLSGMPTYRDDLLQQVRRTSQRPAWSFLERWLPMADIASRPAFVPRLPSRALGMALLVLALLIALAVALVGTRQAKLPAPFGLAANGELVYSSNGDIYAIDPLNGAVRSIVTGADGDTDPRFSPDGTRIAFIRADVSAASPGNDIVVVGADGSNPLVITPTPIADGPTHIDWAPDSGSILVGLPDTSAVWVFDATKTAEPRVVATDADPYFRPFQPPDGSAILVRRSKALEYALVRVDLETGRETVLAEGQDQDLGAARWSPDGSKVVYNSASQDIPGSQRLFVANADGSGTEQLVTEPGVWFDIDPTWSPDGTRIAFVRYESVSPDWLVRPIGIYTVADGSLSEVGPLPREARAQRPSPDDAQATPGEGFAIEWSPDGESLIAIPTEATGHPVVIDARHGTWRNLDPIVQPGSVMENWQRLAR